MESADSWQLSHLFAVFHHQSMRHHQCNETCHLYDSTINYRKPPPPFTGTISHTCTQTSTWSPKRASFCGNISEIRTTTYRFPIDSKRSWMRRSTEGDPWRPSVPARARRECTGEMTLGSDHRMIEAIRSRTNTSDQHFSEDGTKTQDSGQWMDWSWGYWTRQNRINTSEVDLKDWHQHLITHPPPSTIQTTSWNREQVIMRSN